MPETTNTIPIYNLALDDRLTPPSSIVILQERVTDTLNQLGLPDILKTECVVLGSCALVLQGVEPPTKPGAAPRPHDLDLLITSNFLKGLMNNTIRPDGRAVKPSLVRGRTTVLELPPVADMMGVDFIYAPRARPQRIYDRTIVRAPSALITSEGYRAIPLSAAEKRLREAAGSQGSITSTTDIQARDDLTAIRAHRLSGIINR